MSIFESAVPVDSLVYFLLVAALAGVGCYGLYRALLQPFVEDGEWHPANLRRLAWAIFLLVTILAWEWLLWSSLSTLGVWLAVGLGVAGILIFFFTRKNA